MGGGRELRVLGNREQGTGNREQGTGNTGEPTPPSGEGITYPSSTLTRFKPGFQG